jgi:hypothetical protein
VTNELITSITTIVLAIVGLAIVATLVSKSANTSGILSAGGTSLGKALQAAEAPVTGGGGLSLSHLDSGFQTF